MSTSPDSDAEIAAPAATEAAEYDRFNQYYKDNYRSLVLHLMHRGANRETAQEAASEALVRAWRATTQGRRIESLRPYILRIAFNVLSEEATRNRPELWESFEHILSDEETVRAFDEVATVADVRVVLKRVGASGDTTMYRVAVHMLDTIQVTGSAPSTRQVGEELGLSHTGVSKALNRLKRYFAAVRREAGGP